MDFYISFIAKNKQQYSELFNRLFAWVKKEGVDIEIEEILDAADFTKSLIKDIDSSRLLNSELQHIVSFTYLNLKPLEISSKLNLVGDKRGMGIYIKENGNIYFSLNGRNLWGWYERKYLKNEEYEKIEEHRILLLIGLSELFNELVKLCESLISHGSFFIEGELRTRITSSMGYYNCYKDFVFDYSRVLLDSKSNYYFTEYLGNEKRLLNEINSDIENKIFYNNFKDDVRGDLSNFIKKIDFNSIELLSSLTEKHIEEKLKIILKKNEDVIFNKTKTGFTICTYPNDTLWTIYYDFLEEILR